MRNAIRYPGLWLAIATLGLAGCGAGAASNSATPVPVPPPKRVASTATSRSATTPVGSTTSATRTPTAASTTTAATPATTTTSASGGVSPSSATTQTQAAQTLQSCGSVDFGASSSYLATGITATASDCATARTVAAGSRSHQFDPPRPNAPVPSFTSDGFACVGQRDSASMLALSDYRCTRGSSVVTFQRA